MVSLFQNKTVRSKVKMLMNQISSLFVKPILGKLKGGRRKPSTVSLPDLPRCFEGAPGLKLPVSSNFIVGEQEARFDS